MLTVHLPGHSPTSIALFDEHDGVLFPGDVVYDAFLRDNCAAADRFTDRATKHRLRPLPVSAERPGLQPSPGTAWTKAPPRRPLGVWSPHPVGRRSAERLNRRSL
jgi:glyoxylase-like metal-dependent hydrolase (beta-lactamase superfamily II)